MAACVSWGQPRGGRRRASSVTDARNQSHAAASRSMSPGASANRAARAARCPAFLPWAISAPRGYDEATPTEGGRHARA
jgi:hypothetical protein